jgi:CBS domain-containing protein/sporulation protein YlmC with PRC-barrel domain
MIQDSKYFLYLTELLGAKVINSQSNRAVGRISDVLITPKEIYPEITALLVSGGLFRKKFIIPCDDLEPFALPVTKLYLKPDRRPAPFAQLPANTFLLKDTFLDRQILDTGGCKVVRVNDLHLLKENNKIWVVHIDIGFRGIARRLGWLWWLDPLVEWIFSYKLPDRFVSWKYAQAIPSNGERKLDKLTLRPAYQCLGELNPADLAEILTDLDRNERISTFKLLDPNTAAEALVDINPKAQKELIDAIDAEKRLEIVSRMPSDKAADLVSRLSRRKQEEILKQLPQPQSSEIKGLLSHPEQTAGALMTTDYIALDKETTVEQALAKIKEMASSKKPIYFYYIYVIDAEQALLGIVTLRRLLAAQPTAKLVEIMNSKMVKVKIGTHQAKIANTYVKYNFVALPVVDGQNKLKGIILLKDAIDKVLTPAMRRV